MHPDLSVYESHAITEQVEQLLSEQFAVYDIDIHVEPAKLPEDDNCEHVYKKLYKNEKIMLSQIPDYQELLVETFTFIRSEEHTSELQSRQYLVCRLLLEKK